MSDLTINFQHFFPWVSFLAGLGGSLHCVGMCGGLVTASCEKSQDVWRYQLGRLLGYIFLGIFAGLLGSLINFENASPIVVIFPGLFIGVLFLYWGIQNWRGKKAELPMPKFMGKIYSTLWRKLVYKNVSLSKSFFTGLISIFLPCGLLYGIILGGVAIQHPLMAALSMLFFWMGTLPSMILAPSIFQKILGPLKSRLPRTYATSLILIGLMTVSLRMVKFYEIKKETDLNGSVSTHKCH